MLGPILCFLLATTTPADPVEQLRATEVAFAKAFADRDQKRFFDFVLDDASFMGGLRTLAGKKEVVERWSRFFSGPQAPFSWTPERVAVNAAGTIGLSTGPVFDSDGHQIGNYASVWQKQPNGTWKILFDGPGSSPACLPETAPASAEGDITTSDGAKLHYKKAGDGPITLIVPLSFVMYDDFKFLGDLATVITYDVRNRGRSSRVSDLQTVSINQDVKDLEAVRAHFNIDKFVPVGFSYLGLMVAMYAMEHPEHVSRIVQLGPVPRKFGTQYAKDEMNGNSDAGVTDADYTAWQQARAQGMSEKTPKEFCETQWRVFRYILVGDPAHAARVEGHCDLENEWPVNFDRHLQSHFESVKKVDISASDLAKITMPVLVIHGTKDRNAPYGGGREWAKSLPNARLVTVAGAAHVSWADDPSLVFGSIREFLRGPWPLTAEKVK